MILPKSMFTGPNPLATHRRGLTLLEVVVSLAILSLMAGAIYGIVLGSVESTATLAQINREDRRVEAFLQRARLAFAHLPASATVELKVIEAEPLRQELTLRGVREAFIWGDNGGWDKPVVTLASQRWPAELQPSKVDAASPVKYSLAMTVPDFYRTDGDGHPLPDSLVKSQNGHQLLQPDVQGRFWLDLLPEVDRVEWRFYVPASKNWLELQPASRPPLIELKLFLQGRKYPLRAVFETA